MAADWVLLNPEMNVLSVLSDVFLPLAFLYGCTPSGKSESVAHACLSNVSSVSPFGKGIAVRSSLSLDGVEGMVTTGGLSDQHYFPVPLHRPESSLQCADGIHSSALLVSLGGGGSSRHTELGRAA